MGEEEKERDAEAPIEENEISGLEGAGEGSLPAGTELEVDQLRRRLEASERENKGLQDKYLRIYAEFENYKKQAARNQEELSKYGNERLLKEFLPVLDNLERAIFHTKELQEYEKILEGLDLILKQFREVLGKFGVSAIDSHLRPFDPVIHEAMGQLESNDHEPGTVIEEIQKGYRIQDRVLRPAMVIVSKKTGPEQGGESTGPG